MSDSQGDSGVIGESVSSDRTAVEGLKKTVSEKDVSIPSLPGGIASGGSVYVKALFLVLAGLVVVIGGGFALLTTGVLAWLVEAAAVVAGVLLAAVLILVVFAGMGLFLVDRVGTGRVIGSFLAIGVLVIGTQTGFFQYAVSGFLGALIDSGIIFWFLGLGLIVILMKPMWLSSFLRVR